MLLLSYAIQPHSYAIQKMLKTLTRFVWQGHVHEIVDDNGELLLVSSKTPTQPIKHVFVPPGVLEQKEKICDVV